ncbi:leucyl/phenylalanyl-tRNA--protein transferase [Paraglaciecola aestuariivivens]
MLVLTQLDQTLRFPHPTEALEQPNGLLAFGGDLSVKRLLLAYSNGIFPWYGEGEPIMWWSPDPRGVLWLNQFKPSRSLAKFARKTTLKVSLNYAFEEVIEACASIPRNDSGTWITEEMIQAYKNLHQAGHAHSIEVWDNELLVGGLYGVVVGKVFCGESMFHIQTNASKLAFLHLVRLLKSQGAEMIDCQMQNPHLKSLGCEEIERSIFLSKLGEQLTSGFLPGLWQARQLPDE